jgi:peptidoglycan/LPS O-acetylase OafA/YrhL
MRAPARVGELDRIRGLAILLVMLFHLDFVTPEHSTGIHDLAQQAFGFGWCGVDLFFVLSGFLITDILLKTRGFHNYLSTFYSRRALRILPLYYLAVLLGLRGHSLCRASVWLVVVGSLCNRTGAVPAAHFQLAHGVQSARLS